MTAKAWDRPTGGLFLAHEDDLSADGSAFEQFMRAGRVAQRQALSDHGAIDFS